MATSDRLCGYHRWNAIGGQTIWKFISDLDMPYACKKLFPDSISEFDPDKTVESIQKAILDLRRWNDISKNDARVLMEATAEAYNSGARTGNDFLYSFIDLVSCHHLDDENRGWSHEAYEYFRTKTSYVAKRFWEEIWEPFIEQAKADGRMD